MSAHIRARRESGFTLVELMVVVLIIGILVAIAIPVYGAVKAQAEKKTCFANQRTLEGAVVMWMGKNGDDPSSLAGLVDKNHALINAYILRVPPRCPSAPAPPDAASVTAATGAYSFDTSGSVLPCTFGEYGPHGSFWTP